MRHFEMHSRNLLDELNKNITLDWYLALPHPDNKQNKDEH
jgi:hypothetical protein